tara:strand:+ start:102 stop:362 length:261 start_codon:yes stop_codon:yes gene_type:complete
MSLRKVFKIYAIINIRDLRLIDFTQVGETNETTVRKNLDGTEFLIKYDSEPTFIADGSVTPIRTMNHTQALVLMATLEWTPPNPLG